MSSTQVRNETAIDTPRARTVDMKLEVVVIPVSDVDRAKRFYGGLGWRLDADFVTGDEFRVVQFTPPGSPCSIIFGTGRHVGRAGLGAGTPSHRVRHRGGARRARRARCRRERTRSTTSAVYSIMPARKAASSGPRSGSGAVTRSFASFSDPDGNGWLFQEVTARLPGRVDANDTTFTSSSELAAALRRAAAAHGEHEKRTGQHDANWPDWYAEYIVQEQVGGELPL